MSSTERRLARALWVMLCVDALGCAPAPQVPATPPPDATPLDAEVAAPPRDALVDPDAARAAPGDAQVEADVLEISDEGVSPPEDVPVFEDAVVDATPDAAPDAAVSPPDDGLGFTIEHVMARYHEELEFSPMIFLSGVRTSPEVERISARVIARRKDGSSGAPSLWYSGPLNLEGERFSTYMTGRSLLTPSALAGRIGPLSEFAGAIERYEVFFARGSSTWYGQATTLSRAYEVPLERAAPGLCYLPPLPTSIITCPVGARCAPSADSDGLLGACVDGVGDAPRLTLVEFQGIGGEGVCGSQSAFPARYKLAGTTAGKISAIVTTHGSKSDQLIQYLDVEQQSGAFEIEFTLICGTYFLLKQILDYKKLGFFVIDEFGKKSNILEFSHPRVLPEVSVPFGWRCSYWTYGTGDGCHCGCGVPDPDCGEPSIEACIDPAEEQLFINTCFRDSERYREVLDPEDPTTCLPPVCGNGILEEGEQCERFEASPNVCGDDCRTTFSWSCSVSALYNGRCDCGCGIFDPECPSDDIEACEVCQQCDCARIDPDETKHCLPAECGNGLIDAREACEPPGVFACTQDCRLSSAWTCPDGLYGDGICDCGCGAEDIDCHDGWGFDECERCDSCPGYRCASLSPEDPTRCSPPGCGNHVLEQGEACDPPDGAGCLEGCVLDEAWVCSMYDYKDGICDCGCGLPDPDCAWSEGPRGCHRCPGCGEAECALIDPVDLTRCLPPECGNGIVEEDEGCDPPRAGACSEACALSELWTCDPRDYDDGARCDCGCGLADPDCGEAPTAAACDHCERCVDARCDLIDAEEITRCAPAECGNGIIEEGEGCDPPDGFGCDEACQFDAWTCDPGFYGDGFMCNCGCGAMDIDCGPDPTIEDCEEFCDGQSCCRDPNPERLEECLDP